MKVILVGKYYYEESIDKYNYYISIQMCAM